ncbi:hypothetical protein Tco_0922089 [Tanacetum coccineum]|uniref:Uncharacterized protein n=1 Tax=Tanacetum coccineum TaxID=301880 RepID=A0ABQ5CX46_9ASTR
MNTVYHEVELTGKMKLETHLVDKGGNVKNGLIGADLERERGEISARSSDFNDCCYAFQQSQPQPHFKEQQPQPTKDNRRGKRVAKRATVDLVDENEEEEEPIRQCARWTRDKKFCYFIVGSKHPRKANIVATIRVDSFGDILWRLQHNFEPKVYRTEHNLTG